MNVVKVIFSDSFGYPERYLYAKCTPGKTYAIGGNVTRTECTLMETGDNGYMYEQYLGKLYLCQGPFVGSSFWEMWVVEWSMDINEQDTVYSLDEEVHIRGYDEEYLTEEEANRWTELCS